MRTNSLLLRFYTCLLSSLALTTLFFSCKKHHSDETSAPSSNNPTTVGTKYTTGDIYTESTIEQITQELTKSVISSFSVNKPLSLCGGRVDTLGNSADSASYKITFNPQVICSVSGDSIKRSGIVILSVLNGNDWSKKGTILRYQFQDFKIMPACSNCSASPYYVLINGMQSKKNISGGTEDQLKDGDSTISETLARNLIYSFPDSTERLTNLKQRTITLKSGTELTTSIVGIDTITSGPFIGTTGVSLWGKIWNGKDFYVQYKTPKVYKTCSGNGKIVCAEIYYNYKGAYTKYDVYGVDKSTGVPYNTCGCLSSGYFLLSTVTTPSDSTSKTLYPY